MLCSGVIVTNEQYLLVSYFAAIVAGLVMAAGTVALLNQSLAGALTGGLKSLNKLMRRFFRGWVVLTVLLGFMSVSYFDCEHETHRKIVEDRDHLVRKTHQQAAAMCNYLAVGLIVYGIVMVVFLWAKARAAQRPEQGQLDGDSQPGTSNKHNSSWDDRITDG